MNYVEHRFALDVHETVSQESVCVKKGNTAHRLLIHLMEKGRPFHISPECYAVFTAKKPDGKVVFNDCTIEDCVIIYDFTPQTVAAAGLLESEIMLYGADDTLLTSSSFRIVVEDTVYDEEKELDSQTEATALTKLISEATTLITDVEGKLENGEFVGPQGLKGEKGEDYVLTEDDKAEIAEMAAELVDVPGSGGNADLTGVVKSVNGVTPDENGNVEIEVSGGGLSDDAKNLLLVVLQNASFLSDQKSNIDALAAALSMELPDADIETWDYVWDYSMGDLVSNGFSWDDTYNEWNTELTNNGQLVSYVGSRNSYAVQGRFSPVAFAKTTTNAVIECIIEIKEFETPSTVDQGFIIMLGDGTKNAAIYADNTGFKYDEGTIAPIALNTEYKVRLEFNAESGVKCVIDGKTVLTTVEFSRAAIANIIGKSTALKQIGSGATYIKSVKYREVT